MRDLRGQLPTRGEYGRRTLADIEYIVIHHTAKEVDSTAEAIARYHVDGLGWSGIGYAWLVHQDGAIDRCQDYVTVSYHVAGRNRECLGVCLTGDWSEREPPETQIEAARWLVEHIRDAIGWRPILGHAEVALPGYDTDCPGGTWPQWQGRVDERTGKQWQPSKQ